MRVGIIGAGAVGTGMGILLRRRGYTIAGVASRTPASARRAAARLACPVFAQPEEVARQADLIFITTSDQAIGPVAAAIASRNGFRPGQTVIHMSGSLTSAVLDPARRAGALALSLHPLQSCADADRAVANLPGSVFSLEGDREALPLGKRLVTELGGEYFLISPGAKPLYHAAACVASNYLVSLIDLSRRLMQAAGMEPEMAARALAPLIKGTLDNINEKGIPQALTGPIARGDFVTIRDHLKAMEAAVPELGEIYRALGRYTADLAGRKGSIDARKVALFGQILATKFDAMSRRAEDFIFKGADGIGAVDNNCRGTQVCGGSQATGQEHRPGPDHGLPSRGPFNPGQDGQGAE
ncbi:MAG: hypothetical protein PWR22_1187 [Moorella sp. (in: firmicutes)]|uniref:Rossmann-like and DUF2520 domain-containing protein n=1 Tax=unclassified Neomoorella TaxID=2676739 RepID=UPI0010FFB4CF|nr:MULTISPECIES: Rossmann-like and DUF2520 domain-containing protein [unclassified Moorella (in: firmicutes)]MDK2816558.1 hypothetical protein [Moorella sp. (in: firmicutes)]MDK2895182.1 hypothetical protein [Moorella sp. (in: firmicutes)]GEA14612.1 NADP oxidoreductase [Moorella sp. E308F]GEA18003.1 NADP oxidoreductase [Moorella sp. E306M]